jgi:hypothetical protein
MFSSALNIAALVAIGITVTQSTDADFSRGALRGVIISGVGTAAVVRLNPPVTEIPSPMRSANPSVVVDPTGRLHLYFKN